MDSGWSSGRLRCNAPGCGPDPLHVHDPHPNRRVLHRLHERADDLVEGDEAQAAGALRRRGDAREEGVDREQRVSPAVAGAENVPRAEDRGGETEAANHLLAAGADPPVRLHDGSGVGDAHVHEVADRASADGLDRCYGGGVVDRAELLRLRGRGVRDADEVHEGVGGSDAVAERGGVESVRGNGGAAGGHLPFRAGADERADLVTSLQQQRNQRSAEVAGAARGENLQSSTLRSRSAFAITETELNVMAALAIMGLRSRPSEGYRTPAAMGTPSTL